MSEIERWTEALTVFETRKTAQLELGRKIDTKQKTNVLTHTGGTRWWYRMKK